MRFLKVISDQGKEHYVNLGLVATVLCGSRDRLSGNGQTVAVQTARLYVLIPSADGPYVITTEGIEARRVVQACELLVKENPIVIDGSMAALCA